MPPAIAAAAIAAGGAFGGAAISAHAAGSAAKRQTASADKAAELQSKSNEDTLRFEREQAAQDAARYEAAQRANYDQYLTRYKAVQGLGNEMGFRLPDAAAYVPSTAGAPPAGGGMPSAPPAAGGGVPKAPSDPGQLEAFIKSGLSATGGDPSTSGYWVGKWPELVARGQQLNDPLYAEKRLYGMGAGPQDAPKAGPFAGAAAAAAPNTMGGYQPPRSVAAYLNPAIGGGTLAPPQANFRLRSIADYL